METINAHHGTHQHLHALKQQLANETHLFNHLKQNNGCFGELKEIHLRIKELERQIEDLISQKMDEQKKKQSSC